ncbi:MAG: T9SS type A sorting domain-containing protein [candidate division Zixibacteria bacterium]|nr:T9SS type A sorting domain-containing protein [candidate division Zixibacteria bacterium]
MIRCFKIILLVLILLNLSSAGELIAPRNILLNQGGVIEGKVSDEQGQALAGAKVICYSKLFNPVDSVITAANGTFSFMADNGSYYISAKASNHCRKFFPSAYFSASAQIIKVFPSQITSIFLELEQGGAISGALTSGNPLPADFLISAVKIDYPYEGWQGDKYFSIASNGEYLLDGLIPGYYKIFVRGEGYQTVFYPQVPTFEEAEIIEVIAGQVAEEIDFILEQAASGIIEGLVIDQCTGNPIIGAEVSAYQWSNLEDDPNKATTFTDNNGYYELEVTSGYYSVKSSIDLGFELGNFVDVYYDGYYDYRLATVIHVLPLETISGVDFNVDLSQNYNLTISGNIADQENESPLEGARLAALSYQTGQPVAYGQSIYDGSFVIENLISGTYIIEIGGAQIVPNFWPNVFGWQQAETVVLTNVNQPLYNGGAITQDYGTPGFSISGRVVGPSGPLVDVRIYAIHSNGKVSYARSKASGTYNISAGLFEGDYTIFADLFGLEGSYYDEILHLDLVHSPVYENIDFDLSPVTTGVDESVVLPENIKLIGNYPNPFNSSTSILFTVSSQTQSELEIFDIAGRRVQSIPVSAQPGMNSVFWNGRNGDGANVSSGIYFYRLRDLPETRKMILLK